jgi:hypothetical protein
VGWNRVIRATGAPPEHSAKPTNSTAPASQRRQDQRDPSQQQATRASGSSFTLSLGSATTVKCVISGSPATLELFVGGVSRLSTGTIDDVFGGGHVGLYPLTRHPMRSLAAARRPVSPRDTAACQGYRATSSTTTTLAWDNSTLDTPSRSAAPRSQGDRCGFAAGDVSRVQCGLDNNADGDIALPLTSRLSRSDIDRRPIAERSSDRDVKGGAGDYVYANYDFGGSNRYQVTFTHDKTLDPIRPRQGQAGNLTLDTAGARQRRRSRCDRPASLGPLS